MANYTVNIDGVDYPVVNRPWQTRGIYSDEMNLQTAAVQAAKSPSNSSLKKIHENLLQQKLASLDEIHNIKDKIKAEKEREQREREQREREQRERQQRERELFASVYPPGFKREQLAALEREKKEEFDRDNVGGKKRKKMSNKISNKRKKHSRRRRRRRTHSRSK